MKTDFRDRDANSPDAAGDANSPDAAGDAGSLDVAGVFIEYRDCLGNTLGQAAYFDWRARPVPNVGDSLLCLTTSPAGAERRKLHGHVMARHFEIQNADDGSEQVWVRLEVEVASPASGKRPRVAFSDN